MNGLSAEARQGESSPIHRGWNVATACIKPLYNVFVGAAEVILTIDLPYVNSKGVKLRCPVSDVLEVYAQTSKKITFKALGAKHRQGEFTYYHARIRIPVQVDKKKIASKIRRGVLEIHIPRKK